MERLLYSGNLLYTGCAHAVDLLTHLWEEARAWSEPTRSYRPAELSVRYSVGVTLQVFLKTLQK
jgi:hypothetical protein